MITVTEDWAQVTLMAGTYTAIQNQTVNEIRVYVGASIPNAGEVKGFQLGRNDVFDFTHDGRLMFVRASNLSGVENSVAEVM